MAVSDFKHALRIPNKPTSATTPMENNAREIAETSTGEQSPDFAKAAKHKPQRPKLTSQLSGTYQPYPSRLLTETKPSETVSPCEYSWKWQMSPTAKHAARSFALALNQSPTADTATLNLSIMFNTVLLFPNRGRQP